VRFGVSLGWKQNPKEKSMTVVTLPQMLEAGVHFGHQTRRWNPKMKRYIFTDRNGIHIIDLTQTAHLLDEAYNYLRNASDQGKKILFVGTKRQAAPVIAQEAKRCGMYWVNQRWLGGMLTNWDTIRTSVDKLKDLEALEQSGALDVLPKKEASVKRKELERLTKYLGGLKNMRRKPDILLVVDQRREMNAVMEARRSNIQIVSLLDTNCDPDLTDVGIPANDDAIRSIRLVLGKLADAIYEGRHGHTDEAVEETFVPEAVAAPEATAVPTEKGEVLFSTLLEEEED
jgi:small subunit ribosomal protein S2